MGRYANATIRFDFPELSEDDDAIFVTMRNPKTMPLDKLVPADVPENEDGTRNEEALKDATFGIIANMVVGWHVYDANADWDSEALELPATTESVKTLPMAILQPLMRSIGEAVSNPQ